MDIVFFFDILITFNSVYLDSSGKIVTSRPKIFLNYLSGSFFIDLIAVFPFYLILEGQTGRSNNLVRFIRITKLSRVFRGSKVLKVFKNISHSPHMVSLIRLIKTYDGIVRLATLIYLVLIMAHFTACM